nr:MAG TPA: hypothetical protein [Caudoviricetes sp.]
MYSPSITSQSPPHSGHILSPIIVHCIKFAKSSQVGLLMPISLKTPQTKIKGVFSAILSFIFLPFKYS